MLNYFKNLFAPTTLPVEEKVVITNDLYKMCNVGDDTTFIAKVTEVLYILEQVLSKSYGPLGSNTLIDSNGNGTQPIITKDGYTIIKSLQFDNALACNIHNLIKQISNNLVRKVGDGSTSAVITAAVLYRDTIDIASNFSNKKEFSDLLNVTEKYIEKYLDEKLTYQITKDNKSKVLSSIAQISNNNDIQVGKFVSDLLIRLPSTSNVKIEVDRQDNTGLRSSISYGFTYNRAVSHALVLGNKPNLIVDKPFIFSVYELTKDLYELVLELHKETKRNFVILTENMYQDVEPLYIRNFMSAGYPVYVVKTGDISSEDYHEEFIDLAIYLDSDVITDVKSFDINQLGGCASVDLSGSRCIFNNGDGFVKQIPLYNDRVKELEEGIWELGNNNPLKRGRMRVRLNQLQGINATILVGGRTEEEKQNIMYLVEDSVLACKSALEKGYTLGGNIAIYYATRELINNFEEIYRNEPLLQNYKEDFVKSLFWKLSAVYFEVYWKLFNNVNVPEAVKTTVINNIGGDLVRLPYTIFNIKSGELENINTTTVLAPVETDKQIMKATFSIIGMLLSINQFIT